MGQGCHYSPLGVDHHDPRQGVNAEEGMLAIKHTSVRVVCLIRISNSEYKVLRGKVDILTGARGRSCDGCVIGVFSSLLDRK